MRTCDVDTLQSHLAMFADDQYAFLYVEFFIGKTFAFALSLCRGGHLHSGSLPLISLTVAQVSPAEDQLPCWDCDAFAPTAAFIYSLAGGFARLRRLTGPFSPVSPPEI